MSRRSFIGALDEADIEKAAHLYEMAALNLNPLDPKIREFQRAFDVLCGALWAKSELAETPGFSRPTQGEFKFALIKACKTHLKKKNP